MTFSLNQSAALAAGLFVAFTSSAQAGVGDFLNAVVDTTPAGLVRNSAERPGDFGSLWQDTVRGSEAIMKNGSSLWIVPT